MKEATKAQGNIVFEIVRKQILRIFMLKPYEYLANN